MLNYEYRKCSKTCLTVTTEAYTKTYKLNKIIFWVPLSAPTHYFFSTGVGFSLVPIKQDQGRILLLLESYSQNLQG